MADKNLVLSMLAHAVFATICVPMEGIFLASIHLDDTPYTPSICFYFILFAVWLFRDFVIFYRTQPGSYWLQEFLMTGGLVAYFSLLNYDWWNFNNLYVPFIMFDSWFGLNIAVTFLPVLSFIIFSVSALCGWWNKSSIPSDRRGVVSFLFGSRRSPEGRAEFFKDFCDCASRHSVFRRHSFEPVGLAIARGCIAIVCCGSLLVFAIYSLLVSGQKGSIVTESIVPTPTRGQDDNYSIYTIYAENSAGQAPDNFLASIDSVSDDDPMNLLSSSDAAILTWTSSNVLIFPNMTLNWTDATTVSLWILISTSNDATVISDTARSTISDNTTPLTLLPSTSVSIVYTVVQIIYGKYVWYKLIPEAVYDDPDDASSGFSSVKLYWDQNQVWVQQEIETSVKGALQAIGTVGGVFSFVDGIFALIFGRAILALVTGGRPISPFGMMGLLVRRKFRKLIHEQFPELIRESEQRGLAAFVKEVAINIDFALDPDDLPVPPDTGNSTEKFPQSPMV